ncbi:hypothetical protein C8Q79DRAFT_391023 [Trametes meyenii]|nr:hypothetical protein C8Q79DRAFT_391023 [Trametes meyenii]
MAARAASYFFVVCHLFTFLRSRLRRTYDHAGLSHPHIPSLRLASLVVYHHHRSTHAVLLALAILSSSLRIYVTTFHDGSLVHVTLI